MSLYSPYDYLAFVIPGVVVLFQIVIGSGREIGDPGAGLIILLLAAAFLIGHAVAAVAGWLQALAWGRPPGRRPDPLWGFAYTGAELAQLTRELEARYGAGLSLTRLYQLAYTEIQHVGKDARLQTINSQIAFYRNAAASLLVAAALAAFQAATGQASSVDPRVLIPGYLLGALLFIDRYRVFWTQFGDNVVRGFRILAKDQPKDAGG